MYYNTEESGKRIKDLRCQSGLSQSALADAIGIHVKTIGKAERGVCGLSIDNLILIAEYFQVTIDYLINGNEHIEDKKISLLIEKCNPEMTEKIYIMVKNIIEIFD